MNQEAAYISTREAADLLGISLRTAQLWVENGADVLLAEAARADRVGSEVAAGLTESGHVCAA